MAGKPTYNFKATIRFVGFDSEADRDERYRLWVDSQLRGIRLARKEPEAHQENEARLGGEKNER